MLLWNCYYQLIVFLLDYYIPKLYFHSIEIKYFLKSSLRPLQVVSDLSPGHFLVCPTFVSGSLQSVHSVDPASEQGMLDLKPSQMNWKIRELVSILRLWPAGDQHRTSFNGTDNNFNAIKPPISLSTSKAEFTINERWNPWRHGMRYNGYVEIFDVNFTLRVSSWFCLALFLLSYKCLQQLLKY